MENRVGLGTFPLAGVFKKLSEKEAEKIVRKFIDSGGYYIDTAPLYGFGMIENLLGRVLKDYPRDKYYMITKCGYIDVEGKAFDTVQKSGKYDDVIRECERSLKRLQTDYIDLYFVHSPDPETPFDETMKALIKLQADGKIKEIGVSNVNLEELKEYNRSGKVRYIQNRFSLINRSIDKPFEEYLLEKDIKLIPYQLIDRGQLSDKVYKDIGKLGKEDLRAPRFDWQSEVLDLITGWVRENLGPIAKELNISISQLAIDWALHQKFIDFVIVGATSTKYIPLNLKADSVKLSKQVLSQIDKAYEKLEEVVKNKSGKTIREFRGLNEKYY